MKPPGNPHPPLAGLGSSQGRVPRPRAGVFRGLWETPRSLPVQVSSALSVQQGGEPWRNAVTATFDSPKKCQKCSEPALCLLISTSAHNPGFCRGAPSAHHPCLDWACEWGQKRGQGRRVCVRTSEVILSGWLLLISTLKNSQPAK